MPSVKALNQHITDSAAIYHGDCVELIRGLPDNAIDLTVTSIPFSDQYTYSSSDHDMGNNLGDDGFFEHLDWLLPELLRVTVPGRLCAIHVKDRLRYKNRSGTGGLNPFSDMTTAAMLKAGWGFAARITIAKDPVRELQQTKRAGLRYMDIKQDASICTPGIPEYLMVYRKWADLPDERMFSAKPVIHAEREFTLRRWQLEANAVWQTSGDALGDVLAIQPQYDHEARVAALENGRDLFPPQQGGEAWVESHARIGKHAGPRIHTTAPYVWNDIQITDTLNETLAREAQDEKHICPLQLDLIERAIRLWSNPSDVVLDPFAGIGSVPYQAVMMGRNTVGFELKDSYFRWACKYIDQAIIERERPVLLEVAA